MTDALRRIDTVVRSYAESVGWGPRDYRLYADVSEQWGYIHLLLVAKDFPGRRAEDKWLAVSDYLDRELKDDPSLLDALHLTLRTFDEVKGGGIYSIGPSYRPIEDILYCPNPV